MAIERNNSNVFDESFGVIERGGLKKYALPYTDINNQCAHPINPTTLSELAVPAGKTWKVVGLLIDVNGGAQSSNSMEFGYADTATSIVSTLTNRVFKHHLVRIGDATATRNFIPLNFEIPEGKYFYVGSSSNLSCNISGVVLVIEEDA